MLLCDSFTVPESLNPVWKARAPRLSSLLRVMPALWTARPSSLPLDAAASISWRRQQQPNCPTCISLHSPKNKIAQRAVIISSFRIALPSFILSQGTTKWWHRRLRSAPHLWTSCCEISAALVISGFSYEMCYQVIADVVAIFPRPQSSRLLDHLVHASRSKRCPAGASSFIINNQDQEANLP